MTQENSKNMQDWKLIFWEESAKIIKTRALNSGEKLCFLQLIFTENEGYADKTQTFFCKSKQSQKVIAKDSNNWLN